MVLQMLFKTKYIPNINKEGYIFILIALLITFFFFLFSLPMGFICSIITAWCIYFFRDPDRIRPDDFNAIISPADGIVCSIKEVAPPQEFEWEGEKMRRVSIFLNIFDVHVTRIPIDGKVLKMHYHKGKFLNASLDKASIHNERQLIQIETDYGVKIGVVQIAGLIARRIVCHLRTGQPVIASDRFGIIRFGSRVDLYLPLDINVIVKEGQTMVGGETVIARIINV